MRKRRVVITGFGLICPIGCDVDQVTDSLINSQSGIDINPTYTDKILSHISGQLPDPIELIGDKRITRYMSVGAGYAYLSMQQAFTDSKMSKELLHDPRTGLIVGTGGASPMECIKAGKSLDGPKGFKKLPPTTSIKCMPNTVSANIAVNFGIHGSSFSIGSACATSTHAIGEAYDKIAFGRLNTVFAGGCDESDVYIASTFDRARALSRRNDDPKTASRPYDRDRDGFVVSGGGGVIVLEEMEQAKKRNAPIYAEILGYGATSDGTHMTNPSGEGAVRCMQDAINDASLSGEDIDYINTHGTSTIVGDIVELEAIRSIFGDNIPLLSSTKALTGHSFGAAGVHEIIFSIIMMENDFIVGSANIQNIDPKAADFPIVIENLNTFVNTVMSNSFGFGGTNATLIIRKY
jgi:3-oxoacyl-[acyl-carrier-protein] synthase-1